MDLKKNEIFEMPEAQVVLFANEDVITTSNETEEVPLS